MADRTVALRITANVTDAVAKLKTLESASQQWVSKNQMAMRAVSSGLLAVGGGLSAMAVLAVKKSADFEQAMSHVSAATMETSDNVNLLREAALKAGADTMYTATEAAGAIETLAKAGVQTSDILRGGLSGSLNLAAAAQMSVASAAEATATAMNQFGLKGKDATHISDLLAAAAGKAMGDVSDMAGAMKFVGPIAHQMGVSIEETTGTIALLAQQGILGEQAGTSLRGMLMALTSPSKIAADEIAKLGINVYDAHGKFVGFSGVADQLQSSMANLTTAERDQAFGRIFGNEQITTARVLYASASDAAKQGKQSVRDWTTAVDASGYAAEQARIKTDNLKGDVERLGGSLDTVFIKGGSGINEALRQIVQSAEGVVNKLGEIPTPILGIVGLLVGTGGMAAVAVGTMGKIAVAINSTKVALEGLGASFKTTTIAAGAIGAVLAIGAIAFAAWAGKEQRAKQQTDDYKTSLDQATGAITANTRAQAMMNLRQAGTIDRAKQLGISLNDLVDGAIDPSSAAMKRLQKASDAAEAAWRASQVNDAKNGLGSQMSQQTMDAEKAFHQWQAVLGEVGGQQKEVARSQQQLADEQAAGVGVTNDATGATKTLTVAQQAQAEATQAQLDALAKWRQGVAETDQSFVDLGSLYDGIVQKNKDVAQATADQTKSSHDSWQTFYDGQTVSAADYIAGLQKQVDAQARWEQNMVELTTRVNNNMTGSMRDAANNMIDELMQLGPEGANQVKLLHDMSDSQLATVVALYKQKGAAAAGEFVSAVENAKVPVLPTPVISSEADAVSAFLDRQQAIINRKTLAFNLHGGHAAGGLIVGPGTSTSDSIPARLSNGEFVVNAAATSRARPLLEAINSGAGYAAGGYVKPVGPQYMQVPNYAATSTDAVGQDIKIYVTGQADPTGAAVEVARRFSMLGV